MRTAQIIHCLIVFAVFGGSFASTQTTARLALHIEFPNGTSHDLPTVPDGDRVMIQFLHEGDYRTFHLWPRISDGAAGTVRVAITAGRERNSRVLDEVHLTAGAPPVPTGTSPSFGMAVTRIAR